MRSWKVKTRSEHRARLKAWKDSDASHKRESKYVLTKIRLGIFDKDSRGKARWEAWWSPIWRKRYALEWKRDIKHVKDGLARFAEFPYYEDCRYHICKVTKLDADHDYGRIDVEGESLLNGSWSNCSYEHCGIHHLTKEEGEERVEFIKINGMLPYQLKYIYAIPESHDALVRSIRGSIRMDRDWKFNENGGTIEITDQGKKWLLETHGVNYDELTPLTDEEMKEADPC